MVETEFEFPQARPRRVQPGRPRRRMSHERRVLLLAALTSLPAAAVALVLLWTGEFTPKTQWTLTLLIFGLCWSILVLYTGLAAWNMKWPRELSQVTSRAIRIANITSPEMSANSRPLLKKSLTASEALTVQSEKSS